MKKEKGVFWIRKSFSIIPRGL